MALCMSKLVDTVPLLAMRPTLDRDMTIDD